MKLNNIINNILLENPVTILKYLIHGIYPGVYSFIIMTSENPMGIKLSRDENKKRLKKFKELLKNGRYKYIRVRGKYGNMERPLIIFNVNIDDAKNLGQLYNQESFIYAVKKREESKIKKIDFYYYEKPEEGEYKLRDEIDYYVDKRNADDFYTRMKSWKFNIPFKIFEAIVGYNPYTAYKLSQKTIKAINELNEEIVYSDNKTGRHYYNVRGNINAYLRRITVC